MIARLLGLVLVGLLWATAAEAQLWLGYLDASRGTDWTTAGVSGGIPSSTWTRCTTGTGTAVLASTSTAAQINTAIAGCDANHYVELGAGTFTLTTAISWGNTSSGKSSVALRGQGPDQTKLVFTGSGNDCSVNGSQVVSFCGTVSDDFNVGNGPRTWTSGFAKGTTVITLSGSPLPSAGQIIKLDQLDDTADPGTTEVLVSGDNVGFSSEGLSGGRGSGGTQRTQIEIKLVTNVSGNDLTIDPPLRASNWRSGQTPEVFWSTTSIKNVGIEDLSLDYTAASVGGAAITFYNAYNGWVRNVRSVNTGSATTARAHILTDFAARITVRDSYFYGSRALSTDLSTRYGVEAYLSSDVLAENNIFQHVPGPLIPATVIGSVWGYNYMTDQTFMSAQFNHIHPAEPHDGGIQLNLFEGNQGSGVYQDDIHGTQNLNTYFRNQWTGRDSSDRTNLTVPFVFASYNRFMNVIGNVLGEAGYHTNYAAYGPDTTSCNLSIFNLPHQAICSAVAPDATVKTSLYRWGNYDVVTGTVRWCGQSGNTGFATTCGSTSEVPTSLTKYSQAVPASETLPNSFYLSARPRLWWKVGSTTPKWPIAGPDVTGGNVTSGTGGESSLDGHADKNPARLCYESLSDDPTYPAGTVKTFNATTCYQDAGPITTPLALFIATVLLLIDLANLGGVHAKARR